MLPFTLAYVFAFYSFLCHSHWLALVSICVRNHSHWLCTRLSFAIHFGVDSQTICAVIQFDCAMFVLLCHLGRPVPRAPGEDARVMSLCMVSLYRTWRLMGSGKCRTRPLTYGFFAMGFSMDFPMDLAMECLFLSSLLFVFACVVFVCVFPWFTCCLFSFMCPH